MPMKYQGKTFTGEELIQINRGQTLIEYALIVILGTIAVIITLGLLGVDLSIVYTAIRNALPT